METTLSSEMSVLTSATERHIPEDGIFVVITMKASNLNVILRSIPVTGSSTTADLHSRRLPHAAVTLQGPVSAPVYTPFPSMNRKIPIYQHRFYKISYRIYVIKGHAVE
jgi:hypothetical protein